MKNSILFDLDGTLLIIKKFLSKNNIVINTNEKEI